MFDFYRYLDASIIAGFSAVGALVPLSLFMILHYWIRKASYKTKLDQLNFLIEAHESLQQGCITNNEIIFTSHGVKDVAGLAQVLANNVSLNTKQREELLANVKRNVENVFHYHDQLKNMKAEREYIKKFNFLVYLAKLLDKHFR